MASPFLPEQALFIEWTRAKDLANQKKHVVSFAEAKSVFFDEYAIQFYDEDHSEEEDRFVMLGMSNESRVLVVCHCERDEGTPFESLRRVRPPSMNGRSTPKVHRES